MALTPLTKPEDIARALDLLTARLQEGAQPLLRELGYRGGSSKLILYWHPRYRFWGMIDRYHKGRHWCAYGTDDPTRETTLSIVCEINPPVEGINRHCAGVFLRDAAGHIYLAHSGKIGGGRPGVGKEAFSESLRGADWQWMVWPDGKETQVIVIGRPDSGDFLAQLAAFINKVAKFKASAGTSED